MSEDTFTSVSAHIVSNRCTTENRTHRFPYWTWVRYEPGYSIYYKSACAKTQIRLRIHSESPLSAWRRFGILATQRVSCEGSDQTARMCTLIWVFAERWCNFVGNVVIRFVLSTSSTFEPLKYRNQMYANSTFFSNFAMSFESFLFDKNVFLIVLIWFKHIDCLFVNNCLQHQC